MPLKKPTVFSWWGIIIFALLCFVLLSFLFPKQLLLKNIVNDTNTSPLTIMYLKDLIAKNPENLDYKLSLVKQEIKIGHIKTAKKRILTYMQLRLPLPIRWKLQYLYYQVMKMETFARRRGSAKRRQQEKQLATLLYPLQYSPVLTLTEIASLGDDALAMDAPRLAMIFYKKALSAHSQPVENAPLPPSFYDHVGQAALFISDYETSAQFYLTAMQHYSQPEKKRASFIKAMSSLQAGKRFEQALALIEKNLDLLRNDRASVIYIVRYALSANQPQLAARYLELLFSWKKTSTTQAYKIPGDFAAHDQYIDLPIYNEALYQLAYNVYLFNLNTEKSYAIAAVAVEQTAIHSSRQNQAWRQKLAEVALWNHNPGLSAQQYLILAETYHDSRALMKGIALTTTMHYDQFLLNFLHIAFKEKPQNEKISLQMVNAWLRLGEIHDAMHFLNNHPFKRSFYLLMKAKIDNIRSEIDGQLHALEEYTARYPLTTDIALQMSSIYTSKYQLTQAEKILVQAKLQAIKSSKDQKNFWTTYAINMWLTNNEQEERLAYQQLLKQKKVTEKVYIRLIDLYGPHNPKLAYEYAKKGKQRYPKSITLAVDAFSWAIQTSMWKDFPLLDQNTPPSVQTQLDDDPAYGELKAYYLQSINQHDAAVETFMQNIEHLSSNPYLVSDFIFFLVQSNDLHRLTLALDRWGHQAAASEILWGAYAEGYASLHRLPATLSMLQFFYDQFFHYIRDPYWMIGFRDILDSSYLPQQSWAVGHIAWSIYLPLLAQQKTPPDYTQLLNYVKLALQEQPGDVSRQALSVLQQYTNKDTELLMLAWALSAKENALADAIYQYYKLLNIVPPGWAVLSLAINHEDRYLMKDVLFNNSYGVTSSPTKVTSYRDKVQAAQKIDHIGYAQKIAYDALEQHPHDNDLYDNLFTPVMLKTANRFSSGLEYYQYAEAEGPRNLTKLTYYYSPSIRFSPYHFIWFSNQVAPTTVTLDSRAAVSSQFITNIPAFDDRAGVEIGLAQHRGELLIDLGYRTNLDGFDTLKIQRQYQALHDLNTVWDFGYHQLAEDSLGLLVGGMKNDLHLAWNFRFTAANVLLGDYFQNFFYTQDGQHVANGSQLTINWEHRFNQSYIDWTLALYGSGATYYSLTNQLVGSVLTLVPTGIAPTVNFLIPQQFVEYGIRASFGESYIEDYTHRWRPFAALTISNNTSVGFGSLFNLGITGCIFGRDKMLFYYSEGTNQGAGIQMQRLAKATYTLYF